MSCNCGCHHDNPPANGWRRFVPVIVGVVVAGALIAGAMLKKDDAGKVATPAKGETQAARTDRSPARVQWIGEMHKAIHEGDSGGKVGLASLLAAPHLNAIGPLAGLRGEITVIDGVASIGVVDSDGALATEQREGDAAFLVWANVSEWVRVPIPEHVTTEADIEEFIPQAAKTAGLRVDAPLPFRIEGKADSMTLHVVWQEPGAPPGKETHDRAKVVTTLTRAEISIVGFWSDAHRGVFTPGFSDIHIHAAANDGKVSGHVDGVRLMPGATLLLPAWKPGEAAAK